MSDIQGHLQTFFIGVAIWGPLKILEWHMVWWGGPPLPFVAPLLTCLKAHIEYYIIYQYFV